jgi:AraC-like DNA-binding protein
VETLDPVSRLLDHVGMRAKTFYTGPLCGLHGFGADEGVGHLHVLRSGELQAQCNGHQDIAVREPSLLFYPRPIDHRLNIEAPLVADVLCASVHYGVGMENAITQSFPCVVVIPFSELEGMDTTLSLLFAEAGREEAGRQAMLDRLCDVLLIQIVRFAISRKLVAQGIIAGLSHPRLARCLTELLDAPERPWTLEAMASLAHLSRNGFAQVFRVVVGTTPGSFVTQVRVARAQRLLTGGRPLALVAQDVGYSSQPAFSRAFIRELGISPSAWLRSPATK